MDTVTPELTAIIVSWNRCADLRVLLESLGRQDYPNLRVVWLTTVRQTARSRCCRHGRLR